MHSGTVHPTNSAPEIKLTHSESPLDTLVRRTSSRKLQKRSPKKKQQAHEQQTQKPLVWEPYRPPIDYQAQQHVVGEVSSTNAATSNPRRTILPSQQKPTNLLLNLDQSRPPISSDSPHSPLLHSHFPTRDSVLSGSSDYDNSFDGGFQSDSLPYDPPVDRWGDSSNLQRSSNGQGFNSGVQQNPYAYQADELNSPMVNHASVRGSDFLDYYLDREEDIPELPTVIVSSPDDPSILHGRAPVIKPVMANFSRPMRDSGQWHQADVIAERVTPQLPPQMRDQKKAVLERNAPRTASIVTTPNSYAPSPLSREMTAGGPPKSGHKALAINTAVAIGVAQPAIVLSSGSTPTPGRSTLQPHPSSEMRAVSRSSLYSNYSYYSYDGLLPSPVVAGSSNPNHETAPSMKVSPTDNRGPFPVLSSDRERPPSTVMSPNENRGPPVSGSQTAQDFLLLGIEHHEANRLQESAWCFERSAKEGGGCGVGMLMYGLSLRHGWGCPKNEALGFKWVRKAAESAVEDLEQLRIGNANIDKGSIQAELVLAIYEVGQCFFHGWGVTKDQKMGFSYYMVAARLGDGDAQGDLAFCLSNGKGCKKNKKEAARWYRAAVQQGQSDVGLAWIYKDKYQD
jgi:hypothetical protein